jgi:hypothetical protein
MNSPQAALLICVVIVLLLMVPWFIAKLTTKTLLKGKSKGILVAGFIAVFVVSMVAELIALSVAGSLVFRR